MARIKTISRIAPIKAQLTEDDQFQLIQFLIDTLDFLAPFLRLKDPQTQIEPPETGS